MDIDDKNIKQLNIDLKDTFEKNMSKIKILIRQSKVEWSSDLLKLFNKCFVDTSMKQKKENKGDLRYISFSVLLTSILTGKYSLGVGFYDEKFYLDEANVFNELLLKYISDFVDKDIEAIKMWFRKKQQPFSENDLFEMKKVLVLNYIAIWVKELKDEIIYCLNKVKTEDVKLSEKIDITFGSYMEKQAILLVWEVAL